MAKASGGLVEVSLATVSQRIISAHRRDFIALTLITLLLPFFSLYLLLLSSYSLNRTGPPNHLTLDRLNIGGRHATLSVVLYVALLAAFLLCFSQLGAASITRSVLHGFYGRPVRLLPAAFSAISVFPGFLSTSALYLSIFLTLLILFLSNLFFIFRLTTLILGIADPLPYVMLPTIAVFSLAVSFDAVYLLISLVAELTSGFHPPNRSRYPLSGIQLAALSVFLFLALSAGLLLAAAAGEALFMCGKWVRVVVIVVTCASLMAVFLCQAAIYTVLFSCFEEARGDDRRSTTTWYALVVYNVYQ